MSTVTNVIILGGVDETGPTQLTDFPFIQVDGLTVGSKAMEANVWIGAFNYLDIVNFIDALNKVKWDYPEEVQLLIKEQEDEKFSQLDFKRGWIWKGELF